MNAPVVATAIFSIRTSYDGEMHWSACDVRSSGGITDNDLPALAVPDALWEDDEFGQAVYARVRDLVGFLATFEVLDAIHAELRARAGGAE